MIGKVVLGVLGLLTLYIVYLDRKNNALSPVGNDLGIIGMVCCNIPLIIIGVVLITAVFNPRR
jgi:hypothetical protein